MTSPTTAMVAQGSRGRVRARPTCAGTLREDLLALLAETSGITWPSDKYRNDPCAFAAEILGMRIWSAQKTILEAVRDHKRVTVRSGHKIGKSCTAAIIALWFYCSFDDARVVFTSVTARQVDAILWRELGKILSKAGCCAACRAECARARRPEPRPCPHSSLIDGRMNTLARSGFRSKDFREIQGFTARDAEAVAGISGANLLYIPDEASGIDDAIFEAIEGNRAGGARMVMFSNPTRTEGEFYRSHTDKALQFEKDGKPVLDANGKQLGFYYAIRVSSEETPNVLQRSEVFPGLAGHEWVEEKRAEWGVDSPLYKVRVLGEFVAAEDGKIISIHAIASAEARWHDCIDAKTEQFVFGPADGRLHVGLDPAGPGDGGDETAFAIRRGKKIARIHTRRSLSESGILVELRGLLKEFRAAREPKPVVKLDVDGPIGAKVRGVLHAYLEANPDAFELVAVRSSDKAAPVDFDRVRDELWKNGEEWLRTGAIPEDARLNAELHAPEWSQGTNGRLKATPKRELRKKLGRSPDRADSVLLAVWEVVTYSTATHDQDEASGGDAVYDPQTAIDAYDIEGGAKDPVYG